MCQSWVISVAPLNEGWYQLCVDVRIHYSPIRCVTHMCLALAISRWAPLQYSVTTHTGPAPKTVPLPLRARGSPVYHSSATRHHPWSIIPLHNPIYLFLLPSKTLAVNFRRCNGQRSDPTLTSHTNSYYINILFLLPRSIEPKLQYLSAQWELLGRIFTAHPYVRTHPDLARL